MIDVPKYAIFVVLLSQYLLVCSCQVVEIVEHPQTQYVVTGNLVFFHCRAVGHAAYWVFNTEYFSPSRPDIQERYEAMGFIFHCSQVGNYHNLTIEAVASIEINRTLIECISSANNHRDEMKSDASYLFVFSSYRKII